MCPPIAWIVSEVEVEPLKESRIDPDKQLKAGSWPETLSTGEMVIQKYFCDRLEVNEIAQQLNISRQYAHKTIAKAKAIMVEAIKKMGKIG